MKRPCAAGSALGWRGRGRSGSPASASRSTTCSAIPSANEKAVVVSAKIANWTPEGSFHERVVLKTWGGSSYGEDVKVQLAQSTPAPSGGLVIGSTDTTGATIGIAFAIALNLWMVRSFEMVRMDNSRAVVGALIILLLGQCAVLWPALRAASIPPALATRGG